jgi:D-alanine-D-alanine ligase
MKKIAKRILIIVDEKATMGKKRSIIALPDESWGMAKLKVGIIFGGRSGEHEVSIVSATSIAQALDKNKYEITLIGIDKTGRWTLPDAQKILQSPLSTVRELKLANEKKTVSLPMHAAGGGASSGQKFDVILPILHGTFGEDGTIQGLLELSNIPYLGSGVLGSALAMDKDAAKRLFQAAGIPVVPWLTLRKHEFAKNAEQLLSQIENKFSYPVFVKPANMGSSVGVHKIKNRDEALEKIKDAFQYDTKVLIEKAVSARELEVSILGNHQPRASIVGEIIPTHEFYSYEAKYLDENGAHLKIPAENLSDKQSQKLQTLATQAFQALECRGLARVDFFLDKATGEIFLNEINTIPGFTNISMYPKLWAASGLAYPDLLDELIRLALEVHQEKNNLKTSYET